MKESRKDALPGAEGLASLVGAHTTSSLAQCAELAQSQASLQSVSSVGSARGEEGAGYTDVYGDYRPLFNNLQDPDNVSLQGGGQLGGAGQGVWRVAWGRPLSPASPCRGGGRGPGAGRPGRPPAGGLVAEGAPVPRALGETLPLRPPQLQGTVLADPAARLLRLRGHDRGPLRPRDRYGLLGLVSHPGGTAALPCS